MSLPSIILTVVLVVSFAVLIAPLQGQLHKNLKYYETLHAKDLSHRIEKRGTKHSNHPFNTIKEVEFKVLGRKFRLILHPHASVLHSNFRAYTVDGNGSESIVHLDRSNFFKGRVFGEMESHVNAHIDDGVMTASVVLPDETYHIEPSWRHLPHLSDKHMIAYRTSDIKFSWDQVDAISGDLGVPRTCGYIKEGLELEGQEAEEDEEIEGDTERYETDSDPTPETVWHAEDRPESKRSRRKRQADQYEYTPTKTRCPLLLVADYRFFQEMGGSNTKTTINYLISLIDRVHKIYNDTIWQDRSDQEGFKGMGFVIKKIVVHSEPTRVRGGEAHYNMVREKWDVRNLLESTSRMATRCT
ncbi:ADAM 17-like protease isoform X4 [Anopheles gambiae]|uniref:ADAM 17-like protease isoform X4 n=1 Tax=Anopheles gambiae TaxID=7165 RepID=UPI002AC941BB|nr:ADAM 17-like protease isoform X4 [Anopheles gambiae]